MGSSWCVAMAEWRYYPVERGSVARGRARGQLPHELTTWGERARPPNKRMQLTKLRAAPVWQAEVPPCAPAGGTDGGTASQLIRSVRPTGGRRMRE